MNNVVDLKCVMRQVENHSLGRMMEQTVLDDLMQPLTQDEARALFYPMTDAEIEALRDKTKREMGTTIEDAIEQYHMQPGGLVDRLNAQFGFNIRRLPAKVLAVTAQRARGTSDAAVVEPYRMELMQMLYRVHEAQQPSM